MRRLRLTAPAPTDLGIELLGVPAGSPVEVELRLESVMEGVLATGQARVRLTGECARCLDPVEDQLEVQLQELYVYPGSDAEEHEAGRLDGELLDLEPVLRDSVVLALPFQPLCEHDCLGLCVDCGARLSNDPAHLHDESIDPRWAALSGLKTTETGDVAGKDEE